MNVPRVVYLHGFASGPSSSKARFFAGRLKQEGVEVRVPDLAQGDFEHLTISGQLAVVEREAGAGPVALIGSSLGGYLAALYAARHPEVTRAILLAPAFGFARRWPESLGQAELDRWRRTGYREVYHYAGGDTRRVWYRLIEDGQRYEDYPEAVQPLLVVHGTRDSVVSPEFSIEFARRRGNARLMLVDSDHQLLDVLERIWEAARTFLTAPHPS